MQIRVIGLVIIIFIVVSALVTKFMRRNRSKRKDPVVNLPRTFFRCPECHHVNEDPEAIVKCGGCGQAFLTLRRSN